LTMSARSVVPGMVLGELVCARIGPVQISCASSTSSRSRERQVKRREVERTVALEHTVIIGST